MLLEGSALGPEVGRMHAREKNREFTTCDKRQDVGNAEAVRSKQHKATQTEAGTHDWGSADIKSMREKPCPCLSRASASTLLLLLLLLS